MAHRGFWIGTVAALGAALVSFVVFLAAGAGPAGAASPGENGKIAYEHHALRYWEEDYAHTAPPDVFLADPDGSSKTNLTDTPKRPERDPAVSPSGKRVAFSACPPARNSCAVYTIRADGTNRKRIAVGGSPAWSPDGKKLAFVRGYDVWTVGAGGSNQKNLTRTKGTYEGEPDWSPGGGRIAFSRGLRAESDVWAMNPDGSREKNLTGAYREDGFGGAEAPSFSPDGRRIAFDAVLQEGGIGGCGYWNVFTMGAGGSAWTKLTSSEERHDCADPSPTAFDADPSWSPDGKKIAYETGKWHTDLAVMDRDGSNSADLGLYSQDGAFALDPAWGAAAPSTP